jgi:bilirubin oxidase
MHSCNGGLTCPRKIINPVTNKEIWYYELDIKPYTQQVYPGKKPARLVGYNGTSPGPTIIVPRGVESVVRFVNHGDRESSVHLHGSPSRAPFDGWAEDLILPGQYKDYYYPNGQSARMLWYHDHAVHFVGYSFRKFVVVADMVIDGRECILWPGRCISDH